MRTTKQYTFIAILFLIVCSMANGQEMTCHDIKFPTLNSSLYQGVYYSDHAWEKQKVTVSFLNGDSFLHQKVKKYAPMWSSFANVEFEFVNHKTGDIRISFYQGKGSWSLIGKQSETFSVNVNTGTSASGKNGPSMNFGWFNANTAEDEFQRTILHEFGHALGLLHEHMNPDSGIQWNLPRVYSYYMQTQNWSKEEVDRNVLQKYSVSHSNGTYDPHSIMHYPISKEFTLNGFEVGRNTNLSSGDKKTIGTLYPGKGTTTTTTGKPTTTTTGKKTSSPHKYRITNLAYGDNVWAVTMSRIKDNVAESWRTRNYFPEKEIKELWDQGYQITDLTYGNGQWALVMKKGVSFNSQIWRTRSYFPKDEIKEFWDKGYHITNLSYGNGLWALVMSKGAGYATQSWYTKATFPKDEIQSYWDKGYHVTGLTYGNGQWALVISKGTGYNGQVWRTRNYFPKDEIGEMWNKGYHITDLSYGGGTWAVVMSKGTGYVTQSWRTRSSFPENEIKELWEN